MKKIRESTNLPLPQIFANNIEGVWVHSKTGRTCLHIGASEYFMGVFIDCYEDKSKIDINPNCQQRKSIGAAEMPPLPG